MDKKLFAFAKRNCANFYGNLNRRKDYCPLQGSCILKDGSPCNWFQKAVLPLDPALQEQYHQQVTRKAVAKKKHRLVVKRRCKICKKPIAGRRVYCDRCRAKRRREAARKLMRKKREARAGC